MELEEFDYHLPDELIAQEPATIRDHSRMMVVHRDSGRVEIREFRDFPAYFGPGDCVVVNDSRVFPARLVGRKASGGFIEILLLARQGTDTSGEIWEVLLRPAKRVAVGTDIEFPDGSLATAVRRESEKRWLLRFTTATPFDDFLARYGRAPLPSYIKRKKDQGRSEHDLERYQTVYARVRGSVAAPTAGLHFTRELLDQLLDRGVEIAPVTLHVGYGTFAPIETERVEDHVMEEERFSLGEDSAGKINGAARVIAVGTTATRVLESVADDARMITAASSSTRLFIYPGYRFRRIDALLTNFHLPKSSLFLLVCAFAGTDVIKEAYRLAVENRFRFYSYGDCMLII
jgi:S-adenosylmethionine:tRNA ribosyltransferase-isomerase